MEVPLTEARGPCEEQAKGGKDKQKFVFDHVKK